MVPDKARVHVIGDDDSVRRALCRLLHSAGYEVEGFKPADLPAALAAALAPACLVLDVSTQGLAALELQRTIAGTRRHLPVVLITGHGNDALRREALALGARDVLFKPLDGEELLAAVDRALVRPTPTASATT